VVVVVHSFSSLLAVRYHFQHFLSLAFCAVEQIQLVEVRSITHTVVHVQAFDSVML
jgi:hypothetical protein